MKNLKTLFFICLLPVAGITHSHTGASGIVKQRMDAMHDMGEKSKLVADMFKGKTEFSRHAITEAAEAFLLHGSAMAELFPDTKASRNGSKTEALPRIWDEWESFNLKITDFIAQSKTLQETTATTEDIGQLKKAFFRTTKTCSGCHKLFRKPKK